MHGYAAFRIRWQVLLLSLAVLLAAQAVTVACPLCKESVANDEVQDGPRTSPTHTARAYAWSIAVMLCMPFLMAGGITLLLVSSYRRNTERQRTSCNGKNLP